MSAENVFALSFIISMTDGCNSTLILPVYGDAAKHAVENPSAGVVAAAGLIAESILYRC